MLPRYEELYNALMEKGKEQSCHAYQVSYVQPRRIAGVYVFSEGLSIRPHKVFHDTNPTYDLVAYPPSFLSALIRACVHGLSSFGLVIVNENTHISSFQGFSYTYMSPCELS